MPIFTRFADAVAEALARPGTFVIAIALVATWAISGPLFSFSDTWLLAINTGTMLSTFLWCFCFSTRKLVIMPPFRQSWTSSSAFWLPQTGNVFWKGSAIIALSMIPSLGSPFDRALAEA